MAGEAEYAQSLMLLRSRLRDEKEVRVLCSSLGNSRFPWWRNRLRAIGERVNLPFHWAGALIGIELGSLVDRTSEQNFMKFVTGKGILCRITRAKIFH